MLPFSRNPIEYMRRRGLVVAAIRPAPRFDPSALRVVTYPVPEVKTSIAVLRGFEGGNPPDRGQIRPWPSQTVTE